MEAQAPFHQSHACPVQGMDRVVATVSGYHGSERFNLIKLISYTGANYVGSMSKSITHLVCWKFEGKKYDIAQKFNIIIVNHQWIEDCIKEGRRVPEDSFILQSGEEVGPLSLEVPITVQASSMKKNKVISDRLYDIGSGLQTTEFTSGASGNSVCDDCRLIEMHEVSSGYSSRKSRKGKRSICDCKGVSTSAGASRKGRRVVKKIDEVVLAPLLDLSPEDHLSRLDRLHHDGAATSSLSGGVNDETILENREAPDAVLYNQSGTINGASVSNDQIENVNDISTLRSSTSSVEDHLPLAQTSIDACSGAEKLTDGDQDDNVAGLTTSRELSCVICFADFSETRGILPCGHRYCFPCIQSWVDHRASMGKRSTCPLCKASFVVIKKVDHAATTDQKIYSQTIPCDNSAQDIFVLPDQEPDYGFESSEASACVICHGREPEDLLERCDVCRTRRIHLYCLDPPLWPWTCNPCKELRRIYHNHSY